MQNVELVYFKYLVCKSAKKYGDGGYLAMSLDDWIYRQHIL